MIDRDMRDCWERYAESEARIKLWIDEPGYYETKAVQRDVDDFMQDVRDCFICLRSAKETAVSEERETCAKMAEAARLQSYSPHQHPEKIAARIRGEAR